MLTDLSWNEADNIVGFGCYCGALKPFGLLLDWGSGEGWVSVSVDWYWDAEMKHEGLGSDAEFDGESDFLLLLVLLGTAYITSHHPSTILQEPDYTYNSMI